MPPDSPPHFSVIVVCKNPGLPLRQALASVWAQQGSAPELIVVDGGSTDGTAEWLQEQRAKLSALLTGPDTGVYDAMNKGLAAAHGEWVLFLGADDRLCDDTVLTGALAWLRRDAQGVAVGEVAYDDGRIYQLAAELHPYARNFAHHQGAFYPRALLGAGFDATLAVMADYDCNLRLWQRGVRFTALPLRIALCASRGLSDSGRWRGYREEITVRHRHFPPWRCWSWDLLSVLRCLRKKFVLLFA